MSSDAYLNAVAAQHPREDDEREQRIVAIVRDVLLREPWAREAQEKAHSLQIAALNDMVAAQGDGEHVRAIAQKTLKDFAGLFHATIVEGQEYLAEIPPNQPVLVFTNHFGTYKAFPFHAKTALGLDIPHFDYSYPFFAYFAAMYPVAEALGYDLSYASFQYPGALDIAHREAGFIHVPPPIVADRTQYLDRQVRTLFSERPKTALVNFPEGKTTGKYNGGDPWNQEPYKTGGYVIAAEHQVPIILVAQYFDPQKGFRLKVFKPYILPKGDKEAYQAQAARDRATTQEWLDHMRQ